MSEHEAHPEPARRVLALLDASRQSLAALAAAVHLADASGAELVALFVEDADLLECAAFPFAREVAASSGQARPLCLQTLEARLARQVERLGHALEEAVAGRPLRHRLEVVRGRVVSEVLTVSHPGDWLVLGKSGVASHWGRRLGSTCRRLLMEAPCGVIVWDERQPPAPGPLLTFRQENESAEREALPAFFTERILLPPMSAAQLERFLGRSARGALLLHRDELERLLAQDSDLLARLPLPVIAVP